MSKTTRFFEIIQLLRRARRPMLAAEIAEVLEVSRRTIYRDIATLQSMQTPILGEPGVGYVMRPGYDLPPVNFDIDEAEAVAIGLSLVARTGDSGLWRAARRAARKLNRVAPGTPHLVASSWSMNAVPAMDMSQLRSAIRDERKLAVTYADVRHAETRRAVWPLVLVYHAHAAILVAWCELRQDLRHFRLDRMSACKPMDEHFKGQGAALIRRWEQTRKESLVTTKAL